MRRCNPAFQRQAAVTPDHSQVIQAFHHQIWLCCRGMIQAGVSGNRRTLLTQLLLTSLLPHSIGVKDNRLESASVIRWCRRMQVVSVKWNIKECVRSRTVWKWLPNVCISFRGEGFLPVYPALSFSWFGGGVGWLWQNFIVLAHIIVWMKGRGVGGVEDWWGSGCDKREPVRF